MKSRRHSELVSLRKARHINMRQLDCSIENNRFSSQVHLVEILIPESLVLQSRAFIFELSSLKGGMFVRGMGGHRLGEAQSNVCEYKMDVV